MKYKTTIAAASLLFSGCATVPDTVPIEVPPTEPMPTAPVVEYTAQGLVMMEAPRQHPNIVYIYGSERVGHDRQYRDMIKGGDTKFGGYCYNKEELKTAKRGDVVITMRANSADNCRYLDPALPTIGIAGWDNQNKNIGNKKIDHALIISNGSNWGKSIDYYIPVPSLSEAMPTMANHVLAINNARLKIGRRPYNTEQIREVLDDSSDKDKTDGAKYYGQHIDLEKAIADATAPTSTPIKIDYMNGVYHLLLSSK